MASRGPTLTCVAAAVAVAAAVVGAGLCAVRARLSEARVQRVHAARPHATHLEGGVRALAVVNVGRLSFFRIPPCVRLFVCLHVRFIVVTSSSAVTSFHFVAADHFLLFYFVMLHDTVAIVSVCLEWVYSGGPGFVQLLRSAR